MCLIQLNPNSIVISSLIIQNPMASTFASMVGVGVTMWNARVSIVADPISLNIAYGGNSIGVSGKMANQSIYCLVTT